MDSLRIHAPELSGALDWFNVDAPLTLKSLRGKIVLLDFWTYGCVNCMHILPALKTLEQKYRDELVVIGIHSAKFTNEGKAENIRRIIVRYDIDHPVANDARFEIWKAYGAGAWPTQVLIDPEGYVVATASGEGKIEVFDRVIAAVIQFFDARQLIDRRRLALAPERASVRPQALACPGKVLVDASSSRLFVADSSHHRVLVLDLAGHVQDTIGGEEAGLINGPYDAARFYRPQGLALDRAHNVLFVADTENHAVRAVDLGGRFVSTIAGTGRQGASGGLGGAAREVALNSPWDLAIKEGLLYIAMAGSHQIWLIDLERRLALAYAGSGREARVDGSVDDAAFAQPSGIALDDNTLFVADSESNIIRAIDLPPTNHVRTLAGGDLFEFGDHDGRGDAVRLQHPLGICGARARQDSPLHLFIADTYNHKIKTMDPATGDVRTLAGSGEEGLVDGSLDAARFYEPGGVSATAGAIYVADTNNHAIRRIDLGTSIVETLHVQT